MQADLSGLLRYASLFLQQQKIASWSQLLMSMQCSNLCERQQQDQSYRNSHLEDSMQLKNIALIAALALAPLAMYAQDANPTPGKNDYNINQRKVDQQKRIGNGVKSGELTAGETSHLEHQEAGINKEERGMRAQDNGHLTKQDRKTIHHQQNQESRRIYRDKHNDKVQK
jgi:hypothetical protein